MIASMLLAAVETWNHGLCSQLCHVLFTKEKGFNQAIESFPALLGVVV